jgi:hypothetical protein
MGSVDDFKLITRLREHHKTCFVQVINSCITCDALELIEELQRAPGKQTELLPLVAILIRRLVGSTGEVFIPDSELVSAEGMVSYFHDMDNCGVTMQVRPARSSKEPHGEG